MKFHFSFYPLFRVDLVQMIRHGEMKLAIALASRELRYVLKNDIRGNGGGNTGGGQIMVPTPKRAIEQNYTQEQMETLNNIQEDENYGAPRS